MFLRFSLLVALTTLALVPSVVTALHSELQLPPSHQQGAPLHPISISDYETSIGLHRRASKDLETVMQPQNQTEMMYTSGDGKPNHSLTTHTDQLH